MMTNATPNHTGSYPRPGPRQWAGSGHGERARGCGVEPARVRRRCPCAVSAAVFTSGEVGENRLDEFGSLDASDDAQSGAASGTPLDVDAKDALEPLRPAQRGSGRMEVALGGVSRVGGDVVTARPHAPHHLAVVRKRLATSLPRHRETGNKYQPSTCRRHPNNATDTRSPIRIGRLFFLYVVYNPSTVFQTFPFPDGLSPNVSAAEYAGDPHAIAIADAARRLVELRERWINPSEWVVWVDEPVPGYPQRPVARDDVAAKELKARTLTNLYNTRPQWLDDAHAALNAAVAAAYGWDAGISEEDALRNLLALNLAGSQRPNPNG